MPAQKLPWRMLCLLSVLGAGLTSLVGHALHQNALNVALIAAVEHERAADVEGLLYRGADADAAEPWFSRISSSQFDWEMTYSNVSDKGNAPQPVLCLAAQRHDVAMVNILLAHGADVNARSVHDYTALTYAEGDALVTQVLLAHGADPNARNIFGGAALPAAQAPTPRSSGTKLGMKKQARQSHNPGGK